MMKIIYGEQYPKIMKNIQSRKNKAKSPLEAAMSCCLLNYSITKKKQHMHIISTLFVFFGRKVLIYKM